MAMTRITRILVPTDFSATSDEALACAKTLAGLFGASLHVLHAFEDPFTAAAFSAEISSTVPLSLREESLRDAVARLDERLPADQKTMFNGTTDIVTGRPAKVILDYAETLGADLIVMGTHGRSGMAHLLLGSVAERVARGAEAPVLTVRRAPASLVKRILVPTDFSATADAALDHAYLLAERFCASLRLLHVLDDPFVAEGLAAEGYIAEAPTLRTALLQHAQSRLAHRAGPREGGVPVDSEVMFGHGAKTIAEYARALGMDLIVMGTHGRTGIAHLLLGSVAERLVRLAPCPVLTVKHPAAPRPPIELVYDVEHLPA
jgi:nucleotide-binding universal stress UspA family protein